MAKDADHARRVRQRRDPGHERAVHERGAGKTVEQHGARRIHERLDRLEPGVERGRDEILALRGEEAEPLPLARRLELAHELEARVGRGGDYASHRIRFP